MHRIFISYRREDSGDAAGRIHGCLCQRFSSSNLFMDVDSIPPGVDFRQHIGEAVARCDVLLAVIGEHWLEMRHTEGPLKDQRRLDDSEDWVRIEIESALQRNIRVVPVLVGRAAMPSPDDLPDSLKPLAFRNAVEVRPGAHFVRDVDFLAGNLAARRPLCKRLLVGLVGLLGLAILVIVSVLLLRRYRPTQTAIQSGNGEAEKKLWVLSLDVKHFVLVDGGREQAAGVLGRGSFSTHLGDSVEVEGLLSRPAYAFLIAFHPDGTIENCFPQSEDEPPPRIDRPRYPFLPKARAVRYGLDNGFGLEVFALVVSDKPLPSYRKWRAGRGPCPWGDARRDLALLAAYGWSLGATGQLSQATAAGPAPLCVSMAEWMTRRREWTMPRDMVLHDDGQNLDALTPDDPTGQRSKGRVVPDKERVAKLTDWLRQGEGVTAVTAVGFVVWPGEHP